MQRKITVALNFYHFSCDLLHTLLHEVLSRYYEGCSFLVGHCFSCSMPKTFRSTRNARISISSNKWACNSRGD